jgi:hypothetical protein|tara:strand:- start:86 stop:592 length:507 start_codon:yes stop_codon:yes gene_type:complete
MPTENERKYVLDDPATILGLWPRSAWSEIRQGYLPGDARIRRRATDDVTTDSFTCKITAAGRLIEIETVLEARDFDDLWPVTTRRVHKLRTTVVDPAGLQWDIDLLMDDADQFYWAMAECEMPETMDAPPAILAALQPHVTYAVPRDRQAEFSNARLSDPAHAASLSW